MVALQKAINFNGGGYLNHCLWWKNLAPVSQGGGQPPSEDSKLGKQIVKQFGSFDKLIEITNGKLAGIQGSGWAFIVKTKPMVILLMSSPLLTKILLLIQTWFH